MSARTRARKQAIRNAQANKAARTRNLVGDGSNQEMTVVSKSGKGRKIKTVPPGSNVSNAMTGTRAR